jgi:hypothetical protein
VDRKQFQGSFFNPRSRGKIKNIKSDHHGRLKGQSNKQQWPSSCLLSSHRMHLLLSLLLALLLDRHCQPLFLFS